MGLFYRLLEPVSRLERYNSVPMADAMLARDADLRRTFDEWLTQNPDKAADPGARIAWLLAPSAAAL